MIRKKTSHASLSLSDPQADSWTALAISNKAMWTTQDFSFRLHDNALPLMMPLMQMTPLHLQKMMSCRIRLAQAAQLAVSAAFQNLNLTLIVMGICILMMMMMRVNLMCYVFSLSQALWQPRAATSTWPHQNFHFPLFGSTLLLILCNGMSGNDREVCCCGWRACKET